MEAKGSAPKIRYVPVPSFLFGPLLEEFDDLNELRITLRLIRMLHEKREYPRFLTEREIANDRVIANVLRDMAEASINQSLKLAIRSGIFISGIWKGFEEVGLVYTLNTDSNRKAMEKISNGLKVQREPIELSLDSDVGDEPNIFAMYEDNIGLLGPMIAEELREVEVEYPQRWIEDAFREAVSNNKRSLRYITSILARWQREGKGNGRTVRYPEENSFSEYRRQY